MPRLLGIREYRFVVPTVVDGKQTWANPDGLTFKIIDDSLAQDAHAELADRWLVRSRDAVRRCGELGHEHEHGCRVKLDGEWRCEIHLRRAAEFTRTDERTMLVCVDVTL